MHTQHCSQAGTRAHALKVTCTCLRLAASLPGFHLLAKEQKSTINEAQLLTSLGWGKGDHCNANGNYYNSYYPLAILLEVYISSKCVLACDYTQQSG